MIHDIFIIENLFRIWDLINEIKSWIRRIGKFFDLEKFIYIYISIYL